MAKIEERYHKRELKLKVQKGGPAATDDEYLMENIINGGEEDEKERGYEREY